MMGELGEARACVGVDCSAMLVRLKQICNHPGLVEGDTDPRQS